MARIFSAELEGVDARLVEVEVDLNVGLHSWNIVGLGDKAVSEARERVNSALKNSGFKPPNRENRKITVSLAPADMRKGGSHYDLPIALGYLLASGQIKQFETGQSLFVGELALNGGLRRISGALAIAELAGKRSFRKIFLPKENANEAAAIKGMEVVPPANLKEVVAILEGNVPAPLHNFEERSAELPDFPELAEIKGQENAKRALLIAAAGGHNLLMVGPPGVGKSLLAAALAGLLPELHREESIILTKIWSVAGMPVSGLLHCRPFRAPHQNASAVAVIGGGSDPKPGEISLAHQGVLFLDELPEFPRNILEALRSPLESGEVRVARAKGTLTFPARFSLVAAMNPCPCGYYGDPERECRCSAYEILRYGKKISGPLLDRIDLQIRVPRVPLGNLRLSAVGSESSPAKTMVAKCREVQRARFLKDGVHIFTNSEMSAKQAEHYAQLSKEGENFMDRLEELRLSPRSYYRILKTARTIADLEKSLGVTPLHLSEALSFRLREET